jgi:hypothetical protein
MLSRLIGGLDYKGQGTAHPLLGVDPFVLCECAPELMGAGKIYCLCSVRCDMI